MNLKNIDVVIIGAGVIGLSIGLRLKQNAPQLRVAVIGDPMNSIMASRAAAGMLAAYGECDTADPFFEFCRISLDKYPSYIQELVKISGKHVYLSMAGSIMPVNFLENRVDERIRFFQDHQIPYELWSISQVRERLPYLSKNCGEVIWVGQGQVNNRQMHDALAVALEKVGVELIAENATGFHRIGNSIRSVVTDTGEIEGNQFILASGSWSQQLAKILDVSLPLKPIKGQMCRVFVDDHKLEYTIHGILTYIAPWREGQGFVLGSTMEDRGFNPLIEKDVIQGLIDRASAIVPSIKSAPLVESWTGLRPAAEDLMPIMGASQRYQNLFYSTGHYRNGILQTPHQADYVASAVLGTLKQPISEFDPARYDL